MKNSAAAAVLAALLVLLSGCKDSGNDDIACSGPGTCPDGMECVDEVCRDIGTDADTDQQVDMTDEDGGDISPDTPLEDPDPDAPPDLPPDAAETTDAEDDTEGDVPADTEPDGMDLTDTDGDTIRDTDEGGGVIDTDGDTVPDSEDTDSDNDTIPDAVEAGDEDPRTIPVDSNADGERDFRDIDSDGDTILDGTEGAGDADGDETANYRDLDSDGDLMSDSFEAGDDNLSTPPLDTDGDTLPDYLDPDSDNDYIADIDESVEDTDGDTIFDYVDTDSDGDGINDWDEAGDTDLETEPPNCDDDHLPNYRDTDSDNDGLSDGDELTHGTLICNPDSDGDGVSDLVETLYGSDPLDEDDSPRSDGNFVFVVDYMEDPVPEMDTLVFSTSLQLADVFFTIDTSSTMRGEIDNLRADLQDIIIPGILGSIPNVQFGVGRFEDCPNRLTCFNSMRNLQNITSSVDDVQAALDSMTTLCGGKEPYTSNLWAIATGTTTPWDLYAPLYFGPHPRSCTDPESIGWPCFRPGAIPIIIQFGDEYFSEDDVCMAHKTAAEAIIALNAINAKYIGVNSGDTHADMVGVANGTGSVNIDLEPLVFDIDGDGAGLGTQVVQAVQILATEVPIDVSAEAVDDLSDGVDATIFVDRIEPNTAGGVEDPTEPGTICVGGLEVEDTDGDTHPDVFTDLLPGTTVCFDIYPRMNTTIEETEVPQIYTAYINVLADGFTVLDTREVYFLIPPEIPGGN